jgi:hypothetical protein
LVQIGLQDVTFMHALTEIYHDIIVINHGILQ